MKPTTQKLLASFAVRRLMLLDHCPGHDATQAISAYARYRHDVAKAIKAKRQADRA